MRCLFHAGAEDLSRLLDLWCVREYNAVGNFTLALIPFSRTGKIVIVSTAFCIGANTA